MQTMLEIWADMYFNQSLIIGKNPSGLELPSVIASEFSRLVMAESQFKITGSQRAEFIQEQLSDFFEQLTSRLEIACALGGMVFKPYVSDGRIYIDMIRADCFAPISFSADGSISSAVFTSKKTIGKYFYTRLECHKFNAESRTYIISNQIYRSMNNQIIGNECSFGEVPEWSDIQPETVLENIENPLFSYFKIPFANNSDIDSPLGVSVYSRAVDLIKQADEHWKRILWEFEGTELALDISQDTIQGKQLPKHQKRLYRSYDMDTINGSFYNVFSPAIRDSSLFCGLNKILQRIEFNCGLAYGTISEPPEVEKTATEILTSRQRSYIHITAIQNNLRHALENLLYAVNVYVTVFRLAPVGKCELVCTFSDSVLEDTEKEFQRRLQMVNSGLLSKEHFISWYFGCSVEEAVKYLPQTSELFGGEL